MIPAVRGSREVLPISPDGTTRTAITGDALLPLLVSSFRVSAAPPLAAVLLLEAERAMKQSLLKLIRDDRGGEALEYALVTGLIAYLSISVMGAVGRKIQELWTGIDTAL